MIRTFGGLLTALAVTMTPSTHALAAGLKGVIKLAKDFEAQPAFRAPGFWFLPNNLLKVNPPLVDPRMEMVVILEGSGLPLRGQVKPSLVIEDARITPAVIPIKSNTTVTIENKGPTLHILEPVGSSFMKAHRLGPGASFKQGFNKPGDFRLRCSEMPHMVAEILVTDAPQFTLTDEEGSFNFAEVPAGAYTVRVWYRGKWVHSQPVAVKGWTKVEILLKGSAKKD